jgi:hypothetical protein
MTAMPLTDDQMALLEELRQVTGTEDGDHASLLTEALQAYLQIVRLAQRNVAWGRTGADPESLPLPLTVEVQVAGQAARVLVAATG